MTSMHGSNVHEAFALMTTLLIPCVPVRYFELCGKILQRQQMNEVFEERAAAQLCGLPVCANPLPKYTGKYRVSLARREIYDAQYERQFCSPQCLKNARILLSRLAQKPPQLMPSLVQVFGTDQPNPLDYLVDDDDTESSKSATACAIETRNPLRNIRSVWSKTHDLGIVERKWSHSSVPPAFQAATSSRLKVTEAPARPDRTFPTMEQASFIEGYIFPAHKAKVAKKVENMVKTCQEDDDDELIVSDSDEASDVSSTGSFEMSDFDEEEVVSWSDLPLFSHLWGLFSSWITHDTTLIVARQALPPAEVVVRESDEAATARRRARQIHSERWNSLSFMLRHPLPQVARKLQLANDRAANDRLDAITRTFTLREAIETRNTHQWTCIATLLMVVVHDMKPKELFEGERSDQVKTLTKLDASELAQLLELFYHVRRDSDVMVDVSGDKGVDASVPSTQREDNEPCPTFCRKCRRVQTKCICQRRVQRSTNDEFSTAELAQMLQEALVLRAIDDADT
ncbi:hypothetical protein PsorP6_003433 [Peronosclerospora sorghi]|uniref:Uncharacterized protein n=1 Tax=Peronosclerospora sorghi TaxID=230839 RepID=A0ACC0VMJ0_9STRA|nr:hypothetical protein PsorP6_003433 [Peronosclerospora sorghi]